MALYHIMFYHGLHPPGVHSVELIASYSHEAALDLGLGGLCVASALCSLKAGKASRGYTHCPLSRVS